VSSVAVSPDRCLIAVGYSDHIVRLWDLQRQLVERLVGHIASVSSVAFTPDGEGLVSGSADGTLKHWDLGPLLRALQRGALRQAHEVGVEHADSVAKKSGENEGLCVCMVEFLGHKVRVRLRFLCFFCLPLGLVILHSSRRNCFYFILLVLNRDAHGCSIRCSPLPCRTTTNGSYRVRGTGACGSGTCAQGKRSSYCTDTQLPVRPGAFILRACVRLISHWSLCACMHSRVVYSVDLSPTGGMLATNDSDGGVRLCACLTLIHIKEIHVDAHGSTRREI
jgi:WD40 repeat protein